MNQVYPPYTFGSCKRVHLKFQERILAEHLRPVSSKACLIVDPPSDVQHKILNIAYYVFRPLSFILAFLSLVNLPIIKLSLLLHEPYVKSSISLDGYQSFTWMKTYSWMLSWRINVKTN